MATAWSIKFTHTCGRTQRLPGTNASASRSEGASSSRRRRPWRSRMRAVFLCDAVRTPIGRYAGALASVRADDLAAAPIREVMRRNPNTDWDALDDVILGCANQAGED